MTLASARTVCLTVALLVCCCGVDTASATRAESLGGELGSNRKLLACLALKDPTYQPANEPALPLCVTQYFPNDIDKGQFRRVTPDTPEPMSKANAADLAHAWSRDPENPKTDSHLQCSGEIDSAPRRCWSGKGVQVDATFSAISCCNSGITCYIKSGGCVLH